MVKKALTVVTVFIILPSLLFAEAFEGKGWGVGINYPGLSLKYRMDFKNILELKAQFGKDILVAGPRYYRNFSSKGKTNLFFGGEADYVKFEGVSSEGSGFALGAFVGGKYFINPNFGVSLDIGPAYISLKDKKDEDVDES